MSEPLVSVILPTLNRAAWLARSAGSVLAQTYRNLELIVVDDGSTEDVEAAVHALADPRVRYVRREQTGGPAAARNTGLAQATGEYLAFQDSDDEWLLDKLHIQVDALQNDHNSALCLGTMLRVIDRGFRVFRHVLDGTVDLSRIASRPVAYTQTWLIRRQIIVDAGGFDERLWIWEDWELLLRLAEQHRILSASRAIAVSERRADSLTQTKHKFIEAAEYIIGKHGRILSNLPRQNAELHYMLAHRVFDADGSKLATPLFRQAALINPLHSKAWIYWFLCSFGAQRLVSRLRGSVSGSDSL